jgi:hypothetical protein
MEDHVPCILQEPLFDSSVTKPDLGYYQTTAKPRESDKSFQSPVPAATITFLRRIPLIQELLVVGIRHDYLELVGNPSGDRSRCVPPFTLFDS